MKQSYDNELRNILLAYEIREPGFDLINRTRRKMHEEMTLRTSAASSQTGWVLMLAGLAIAMSLCLFYMLTVGTILWFVLPASMLEYLRHSMYAFTAAGGSVLAGVLIVLFFKQFQAQHTLRTSHVF
ncbi:hypothetical protein ACFL2X_03950 [Candidatus Latescibacterota bacterium]